MPRVDTTSSGSVLGDMYGALTKVFGGLWSRYGGWGWSRIRLFLPSARFDWEREAGDVWMNSIVGLAISWLGDRFARPLIRVSKISRNGDYVPMGRHAAVDLWNRPNDYYGRRTLEKAVGLSLKVDGNAYLYKVRDNLGRIKELWWIPHYRILPTWPPDGGKYIDGYRVWLDVAVYHLPPEDVIHIRDGIDPRNERLGLAAVRANLREVVTVNFESGYTASILKNCGMPGVAIVPDSDNLRPTKEDAERVKERFVDNFSNDNVGSPMVMAGKYKIVELGFSPEKMMLDKLPQNAVSRIAASIGVAPMSLGLSDPGKTYANLQEANRTSWGTIVAVQELVAEALRWQLLPEFGIDPHQYVVEYDYSHVQELQESLDAVHTRAREDWKAGGITQNEYREQIGYEPDPGGDRYFPGSQLADVANGTEDGAQAPVRDVQQTALNGAQIASLIQIVEAIGQRHIPADSARAMIAASFPGLDDAQVDQIVGPASDFEAPASGAPENGSGNGKALNLNGWHRS
jgi:HK97 family phage portal protein